MTPTAARGRLHKLRQYVRAHAPELRALAVELDHHDGGPTPYPRSPLLDRLATLQIPPAYATEPLLVDGEAFHLLGAEERVVFHEEAAAHGDAAVLLSAPGSLTAGMLVAALGDEEQQSWFFGQLRARPSWTFLAMTEPQGGTDAATLLTTLTPAQAGDGHVLNGSKRYVGNAHRGRIGVVTACTGPGPLGIRCALVDTAADGVRAEPVATLGLRGALGSLTFDAVYVPDEHLLGRHLSPTRRGMWGWLHSFNVLRCVAAALGVGLARAAHRYLTAHADDGARHHLEALAARIHEVQSLTHSAARAVDTDPASAHLPAAAKAAAAALAEEVTARALALLGPGARADHPLLDKWARDARGIEFMEGTSYVQWSTVFGALTRDGADIIL